MVVSQQSRNTNYLKQDDMEPRADQQTAEEPLAKASRSSSIEYAESDHHQDHDIDMSGYFNDDIIPIPEQVLSDDIFDIEMRDPDVESFQRETLFPEDRQEFASLSSKQQQKHISKEPVQHSTSSGSSGSARRDIPLLKSSSTMNDDPRELIIEQQSMRNALSWFSDSDYDEYDKENQWVHRDETHIAPHEFSSTTNPELSLHLSPAFSEGGEPDPVHTFAPAMTAASMNAEQCT